MTPNIPSSGSPRSAQDGQPQTVLENQAMRRTSDATEALVQPCFESLQKMETQPQANIFLRYDRPNRLWRTCPQGEGSLQRPIFNPKTLHWTRFYPDGNTITDCRVPEPVYDSLTGLWTKHYSDGRTITDLEV